MLSANRAASLFSLSLQTSVHLRPDLTRNLYIPAKEPARFLSILVDQGAIGASRVDLLFYHL
jgi:hypothetical protein